MGVHQQLQYGFVLQDQDMLYPSWYHDYRIFIVYVNRTIDSVSIQFPSLGYKFLAWNAYVSKIELL